METVIEIRDDPEIPRASDDWALNEEDEGTLYLSEYDDPEEIIYTLFVDSRRVVSFREDSIFILLQSPKTLAEKGDRIAIGSLARDGGQSYLERDGERIVVSRGWISYRMSGEALDETEVLAEFPIPVWSETVIRFVELLRANRAVRRENRRRHRQWYW